MQYLYLSLAFFLNAFANILLKIGARQGFNFSSFSPLVFLSANWHFIAGSILFAANAVFYFLALKSLPISIAYPIMVVMSFIIINGYAFAVLKEPISFLQILGYIFIIIGLICVVAEAH